MTGWSKSRQFTCLKIMEKPLLVISHFFPCHFFYKFSFCFTLCKRLWLPIVHWGDFDHPVIFSKGIMTTLSFLLRGFLTTLLFLSQGDYNRGDFDIHSNDGSALCDKMCKSPPSIVLLPFLFIPRSTAHKFAHKQKEHVILCKVGQRLLCALQYHWLATSTSVNILWLTDRTGPLTSLSFGEFVGI